MSTYKKLKFIEAVDTNEQKKCSVKNCYIPRRKISKHCRKHDRIQALYGHPLGRHISKNEYRNEQDEVQRFLNRYQDHEAVMAAIHFFESWLKQAQDGQKVAGRDVLRRMCESGVSGRECLHAVLSLWLYSNRRYSRLPDDIRLNFAFSYAFLALCRKGNKAGQKRGRVVVKTSERRRIGEVIREKLNAMAAHAIVAINQQCDREGQLQNDLLKEFE